VSARLEAVAELAEVLDDAVMDDRDLAGAVRVGMSVQIIRAAVGRPTRMREAHPRVRRSVGERRGEIGELAGLLLDEESALLIHERDPGRIVAAILETAQAFQEDRARGAGSGIADDAAHPVVRSLV